MKLTRKGWIAAGLAVAAFSTVALAAGMWSTLPIVGGASFCPSAVSGVNLPASQGPFGIVPGSTQGSGSQGICGQTVPQGPNALTGVEMIPADTQATGQPQTVTIPSGILGTSQNRIIGGDFNTNLWQRGTTPVSAATPSTTVIGADRWAVYSSTNTVTVIKETGTTDTIPASGIYASMRFGRPSSTTVTQLCTGQVLDKQAAAPLIGNNAIFSTYLLAGAGFAAAVTNSNVTMTIAYYTASDSATPLTNTDLFMKGTITGYQAAVGGVSLGTTGTIASGVATIPISTTWTRYAVWASIPTVNSSGTAVTGVGVTICYTPAAATTGGSTEWFEVADAQLEGKSSISTAVLPNGIISPTAFERRQAPVEASYQTYYTASGGLGAEIASQFYGQALCDASGTSYLGVAFNPPMREAPTTGTATLTTGGYSIETAATIVAGGTLSVTAASAYGATIKSTAACTTTLPYAFIGTATTGLVLFSAEP